MNNYKTVVSKKYPFIVLALRVSKSASNLGDSGYLENSKLHISLISDVENQLENDINYLRTAGVLNTEVEIES